VFEAAGKYASEQANEQAAKVTCPTVIACRSTMDQRDPFIFFAEMATQQFERFPRGRLERSDSAQLHWARLANANAL